MASTYSEYLRLELIGTGEQTGTWGSTTNTNLGTLLDQAVAGTATIDVTIGDVTLTALNGASDQSRQAILKITGTPVAPRNVIAPEQSKWYLISNECGQTITLKGAATTGYAIATGETLLMFWNGTDFVPGSSTALGYTPVNKAGDTMSGALYLPSATPTLATQATTKAYVDAAVTGAVGSNFVLKTGDTMTGALTLPGAPTTSLQAATKGYVDSSISGAGYATQSWVTSQNYATNTTQSLQYYYTKTDSDSRYVSTSTQNLQYYPLTTYITTNYYDKNTLDSAFTLLMPKSGGTFTGTITSQAWNMTSTTSMYWSAGDQNIKWAINGNTIMQIGPAGNFEIAGSLAYKVGGGTWTASSDSRLKDNVAPLSGALSKITSLNPVSYKWKYATEEPTVGFIAQEVANVLPSAVSKSKPTDAQKPFIPDEVYAIGWQNDLFAYLVGAIKELKAEVDALKVAK